MNFIFQLTKSYVLGVPQKLTLEEKKRQTCIKQKSQCEIERISQCNWS